MKRMILAAIAIAIAFGLGAVVYDLHGSHRINETNHARITPGMSEAEVHELLGEPPIRPSRRGMLLTSTKHIGRIWPPTQWYTHDYCIQVYWTADRRVHATEAGRPVFAADVWIDWRRRWLGI